MKIQNLVYVLLVALTLGACTSYKKVPYLQNAAEINLAAQQLPLYDAKIMPKDLLSITINTTDPKVSAPFNLVMQTPVNVASGDNYSTSQPTIQQYLVSNTGEIDFPILGRIKVGGLTKSEAEDLIRQKLEPYIKEKPIVNVRMSNYKISVLGEVNHPGNFTVGNEKINVLEALAMAGDLTVYGIRDNVKLIRENADGKQEIITLNLNDANLITSPFYYLKQNDILYITPNKAKAKGADIGSTTGLWFSAISIVVSVASLLFNVLK